MNKISEIKARNIGAAILDNKEFIYPSIFYVAGLFLGSFLCTYSNPLSEIMKNIISTTYSDYLSLFLNRFSVYISVYSVTVLFGLCLIGFPFINVIPFLTGVEIGLKVAFYYTNYPLKGIGYSLLMVIPESAAFVTFILLSIKTSASLSKGIYLIAVKKEDTTQEINLKSYLKTYMLYAFYIAVIAAVNALAAYLLNPIIQI